MGSVCTMLCTTPHHTGHCRPLSLLGEGVSFVWPNLLSEEFSSSPDLTILRYSEYDRPKGYLFFHSSFSYSLRSSLSAIDRRFTTSWKSRSSSAMSVYYLLIHTPSLFFCSFLSLSLSIFLKKYFY